MARVQNQICYINPGYAEVRTDFMRDADTVKRGLVEVEELGYPLVSCTIDGHTTTKIDAKDWDNHYTDAKV